MIADRSVLGTWILAQEIERPQLRYPHYSFCLLTQPVAAGVHSGRKVDTRSPKRELPSDEFEELWSENWCRSVASPPTTLLTDDHIDSNRSSQESPNNRCIHAYATPSCPTSWQLSFFVTRAAISFLRLKSLTFYLKQLRPHTSTSHSTSFPFAFPSSFPLCAVSLSRAMFCFLPSCVAPFHLNDFTSTNARARNKLVPSCRCFSFVFTYGRSLYLSNEGYGYKTATLPMSYPLSKRSFKGIAKVLKEAMHSFKGTEAVFKGIRNFLKENRAFL